MSIPFGRCQRCREYKPKHPDSDGCNDCKALLDAAYRLIDNTAQRAKAQAYYFWARGGANFINECKSNISERKVFGTDPPARASISMPSSP